MIKGQKMYKKIPKGLLKSKLTLYEEFFEKTILTIKTWDEFKLKANEISDKLNEINLKIIAFETKKEI